MPERTPYERRTLASVSESELLKMVEDRTGDQSFYGDKQSVNYRALLDVAYYNGFQYTYFDEARGQLRYIPRSRNRSRIIDNRIMPHVQRATNLLSQNIHFRLRPKGTDFRSKAEAKNGERALLHLYRVRRWKRKIRRAMRWCATTGVGFIRTVFDPYAGPTITIWKDPKTGEVIPEEALSDEDQARLAAEGSYESRPAGDVDLEVYTIFDVNFPEGAVDLLDCPWYAIAQRKSLDFIRSRFPEKGEFVHPEPIGTDEKNFFEGRMLAMAGLTGRSGSKNGLISGFSVGGGEELDDSAILRIVVEQPSIDNPTGRMVTVANGVVLDVSPSPQYVFGLNGHDLHKFDFIERPGSIWPISLVENLIPLQREHNSTRSHRADLRRHGLVLRTMVPRGASMSKAAQLSGDFHTVIEVDPQALGGVTHAPFPSIPPSMFAESNESIEAMRDIASQHEATQGMNPEGVRSGYAINVLNEADLHFYREIIEGHAETFEIMWANVHQMVKRVWTVPRFVEELDQGELVWAGYIGQDDLAENARVIVDVENAMPQSRAAKQAFASELLQYAPNLMQMPPMVRSSVLEAMEIGDATEVRQIFLLDKRWAERAIEVMIGDQENGVPGKDMEVRPGIDNHEVILQVVRNFQKTAAYDRLPPDAKQRIERYAQGQQKAMVMALAAERAFIEGPQPEAQGPESTQPMTER